MPSIKRKGRGKVQQPEDGDTSVAVMDADDLAAVPGQEWRAGFDPMDPNIPIVDAVRCMTPSDWLRHVLYLYRVNPRVKNKQGEFAYINRWSEKPSDTIDEDWVQREHGGGMFQWRLNDDALPTPNSRTQLFTVDGPPKIQPGQVLVQNSDGSTGVAASGPPPAQHSQQKSEFAELATLVRDVVRDRPGDAGAAKAVETMQHANEAAISIVRRAAEQTVVTGTGHPLMDRMLEKMMDRMMSAESNKPAEDPRMSRLMDAALENLINPRQPPAPVDGLGELRSLKDLFGADNLLDLIRGGGGTDWKAEGVKLLGSAVMMLPQLLQVFRMQRAEEFQRQMYLRSASAPAGPPQSPQAGAPVIPFAPRPAMPSPGAPPPPPVMPPAAMPPGVPAMSAPVDPAALALDDIVRFFDQGFGAEDTADFVADKYPAVVAMLKPFLQSKEFVEQFARTTPPLSDIAGDPAFPEFMQRFVARILSPPVEDEETPPTPGGAA